MKIAVTSQGKNLDAPVSRCFGRSSYVFVADTESRVVKIIDNHAFARLSLGAGSKTAEMLAFLSVRWVATGEIGQEAFDILHNGGIKVVVRASGSCRDILDRLDAGGLEAAVGPAKPVVQNPPKE